MEQDLSPIVIREIAIDGVKIRARSPIVFQVERLKEGCLTVEPNPFQVYCFGRTRTELLIAVATSIYFDWMLHSDRDGALSLSSHPKAIAFRNLLESTFECEIPPLWRAKKAIAEFIRDVKEGISVRLKR